MCDCDLEVLIVVVGDGVSDSVDDGVVEGEVVVIEALWWWRHIRQVVVI
jgi:hypothetical protein